MRIFKAYFLIERAILRKNLVRTTILILLSIVFFFVTNTTRNLEATYIVSFCIVYSTFIGSMYANFSTAYEFDENMDITIFYSLNHSLAINFIKLICPFLISTLLFIVFSGTYNTKGSIIHGLVVIFNTILSNIIVFISINIFKINKANNFFLHTITIFVVIALYIYIYSKFPLSIFLIFSYIIISILLSKYRIFSY